ncbi:lambda-exonuclease family protein [uncultured Thiocystis sp.]|jgi:putative phage-type endonuclease|uniref:YqaJ viral recombinase family nuclease n=1 Tax=uncultured Thiocystis sp. TaxID=1202134 RepID=UPI0025CDF95C|nr:YqaJ viral recombinase family protein [uncultured Thiocystis sp.]
MKVVNLSQRSSEWLAWRSQGVTASEAAVIVGRSPYKTLWRLWAEKTGLCEPDDLSANPFVQRGMALEDDARQGFEERHSTMLLPICAESDLHPALRCSFDGIGDDGEPVELKVPAQGTWDDIATQGTEAKAYQIYWVQVQFQILVANAIRGWLVFDPQRAGVSAMEFEIARDDAFIEDTLIPECLAFHEAVQKKKEPTPDPTRDLFVPVDDERSQWTAFARQYREAAALAKTLEDEQKAMKALMANAQTGLVGLMGEFLLAEQDGVRITRYRQQGSVDYLSVLAEVAPDLDPAILNAHRRGASERVKVTVKDEPTAKAAKMENTENTDTAKPTRARRQPKAKPVKVEEVAPTEAAQTPVEFGYF